jgi:hypothetical protein
MTSRDFITVVPLAVSTLIILFSGMLKLSEFLKFFLRTKFCEGKLSNLWEYFYLLK